MTETHAPLSNAETAAFCSQIAMILRSGISSIEGISIMLEDTTEPEEKRLLESINTTLLKTGSLHLALEDTHAFPDYMIQMVQIGEQAGKLDEVMTSLADYYEKEAALNQTIRNAVTYPLLMIFMMILVILVLVTKVMPIFNQVFAQLGREMSGLSLGILQFGQFLSAHIIVCGIVLVLLAAGAVYLLWTKRGHQMLLSFMGKLHGGRSLQDQIGARRFASGMALTLSSGLTPAECLKLSIPLIENGAFRTRLEACSEAVTNGEDLCETLLSNHIFSGIYAKMASIGSKTGVLEEVMNKIAGQYEEEIDNRLSRMITAIEPTLVIILSVIVGIILLSVMLPLISIMATL